MKTCILLISIFANVFLADAQTFTATVDADIPNDGTSIEFTLPVSGLAGLIDTVSFGLETVCLNIHHPSGNDLHVRLVAPDGSSCLLFSNDGSGGNFINTCINQTADEYIYQVESPFTGTWKPEGDMGALNNGQDPNGIWKLIVYDMEAHDAGTMEDWSVTFGNNPATAFPFHASNLPIVKINTGGHWIMNGNKIDAAFSVIDNGPGEINYAEDSDYAYTGIIAIDIQGYTSVNFSKKSYDIDLLDAAGNEIDTVLLGLPSENDFIIRADYGEPTFMKNELAYEMTRRSGNYAPRTRYCELILDGEYEGLYSFQEKVDRDEQRMNMAKLNAWDTAGTELTGGYLFKSNIDYYNWGTGDWVSNYPSVMFCYDVEFSMINPKSDSIQPQQLNYIHAYTDSFENALNGPVFLDSLNGYRKFVSAKSFVDVMLINELMGNLEGYIRNIYFTKEKITDGGQLKIGPQTDFDHSAWESYADKWIYSSAYLCPMPFWWIKLLDDPEFLAERYCRYNSLHNSIWDIYSFENWIDSVQLLTADPIQRNYSRWTKQDVDYEAEVTSLRDYLQDHLVWLEEELNNDSIGPPDAGFSFEEITAAHFLFTPVQNNADYLWDFGDGSASKEQNPEHIYTESGEYIITLTVNYHYGCSSAHTDTASVIISALNTLSRGIIKISPNPVSNNLLIQLPLNSEGIEISVFNYLGKNIFSENFANADRVVIPMSVFPDGAYIVKIDTKEMHESQMVVKNK